MALAEVPFRIEYFHGASDEYLRSLGIDRRLLPSREEWLAFYAADFARPLPERQNYLLAWELDGRLVGFSAADHIRFGEEAFMHLHVVAPELRGRGIGTACVRRSAARYFADLCLQRLYCEPNAFNTAPNRTLQRAGFRYLFTHEAAPNAITFVQATTRWVLEAPAR